MRDLTVLQSEREELSSDPPDASVFRLWVTTFRCPDVKCTSWYRRTVFVTETRRTYMEVKLQMCLSHWGARRNSRSQNHKLADVGIITTRARQACSSLRLGSKQRQNLPSTARKDACLLRCVRLFVPELCPDSVTGTSNAALSVSPGTPTLSVFTAAKPLTASALPPPSSNRPSAASPPSQNCSPLLCAGSSSSLPAAAALSLLPLRSPCCCSSFPAPPPRAAACRAAAPPLSRRARHSKGERASERESRADRAVQS